MNSLLSKVLSSIQLPDAAVAHQAQRRLDSLTKPKGSLGRLEEFAIRYYSARGTMDAKLEKPAILTFAGDHGVADEGVSAFPQEVTPQMVANISAGGAAVSVLSRHAGASLKVIDVGVKWPCEFPGVIRKKVAPGTKNFAKGPAMTIEETEAALCVGIEEVFDSIDKGATIIGTGDMGIANTTPSTALYSVFLNIPASEITGRGTGIDDQRLLHKISVIEKAVEANRKSLNSPLSTLAALGGFEIAGICGAILGAASRRIPVVVDGFISGAAAVAAMELCPEAASYMFFSHLSAEAGHRRIMSALEVKPVLDFDMRLGEGTGAAIAITVIDASVKIAREMATFDEAGVSKG